MSKKGVFCKPKGAQPTRHLYIANLGPDVGISKEECQNVLSKFGAERVEVSEQRQGITCASFGTIEQAVEAQEYLRSAECKERFGRAFVVKFADCVSSQVCIHRHSSFKNMQEIDRHSSFSTYNIYTDIHP